MKHKGQSSIEIAIPILIIISAVTLVFSIASCVNRMNEQKGYILDKDLRIVCIYYTGSGMQSNTCTQLATDNEVELFRARYVDKNVPVIVVTVTPQGE